MRCAITIVVTALCIDCAVPLEGATNDGQDTDMTLFTTELAILLITTGRYVAIVFLLISDILPV